MNPQTKQLLWVLEQGGYPNFSPLYQAAGFQVTTVTSTRKAIAYLKKATPAVIVAEFNYQSDFRDRMSSLESLLAAVQRAAAATKVIVFYERETQAQLDRLLTQFSVFATLAYPIDEERLRACLQA
jgi:DNA-binding NtrC family response regulator